MGWDDGTTVVKSEYYINIIYLYCFVSSTDQSAETISNLLDRLSNITTELCYGRWN